MLKKLPFFVVLILISVVSLCFANPVKELFDLGTKALMEKFYKHMARGKISPIIALNRAKQDMLFSDEFSMPVYWASFNLYGLGV